MNTNILKFLNENNLTNFETTVAFLENGGYHLEYRVDKNLPDLYLLCVERGVESHNCDWETRALNGMILQKSDNRIVCYGPDKCLDVTTTDPTIHAQVFKNHHGVDLTCAIQEAVDGTMVRLFYYEGKWRLSTTRKIDAYKSYWIGGPKNSFGKQAMDILTSARFINVDGEVVSEANHLEQMSKVDNCQYTHTFVLCSTNRHVVKYSRNHLVWISMRNNTTLEEYLPLDPLRFGPDSAIVFPTFHAELTVQQVSELVKTNRADFRGYVVTWLCNGVVSHRVLVDNVLFTETANALNNCADVRHRYLELLLECFASPLNSPADHARLLLETHYKDEIAGVALNLSLLANHLHHLYIAYYIDQTLDDEDYPDFHQTLSQLNGLHRKRHLEITPSIIYDHLSDLGGSIVSRLLTSM